MFSTLIWERAFSNADSRPGSSSAQIHRRRISLGDFNEWTRGLASCEVSYAPDLQRSPSLRHHSFPGCRRSRSARTVLCSTEKGGIWTAFIEV